jgi:hypothetical protein
MIVTVNCSCGQPYEFEVEPADGKMPVEVHCPACASDGTEAANSFIADQLTATPPRPSIRVVDPEVLPTPALSAAPRATSDFTKATPKTRTPAASDTKLSLGVLGAAAGGLVGMIAWYLLIKFTGFAIGYAAWGVGVLAGLGARALAGNGSKSLGMVAGVCAFVAVIGGQYLAVKSQIDGYMATYIEGAYDKQINFAQAALKAGSDEELRTLLVQQAADDGQGADPSTITSEKIAEFRQQTIPKLESLVKGKPSREEFATNFRAALNSLALQGRVLKESIGLFTLLWLFLGVSSAYRIAAGSE